MSNPQVTIGVNAIDTSKQVLQSVDQKVAETADKVIQSGDKIESRWSKFTTNFKARATDIASAVAGLGAGIVGFATSFDTLEKAQLRSDQANLMYQKSLERLSDLQNSGKASSADLANAQEQVRIAAEKARLAQDTLGDTYTNFLANVPSQLISFGTSAIGIFNMLKVTQVSNAAATVASSATYSGALVSMNAANAVTTTSTKVLSAAFKSAFLTNPVGLIITGVATAAVLLATNFDKVSAAFEYAGRVVFDFIDRHFKPLADLVKWFIDGLNSLGAGLTSTAVPALNDTADAVIQVNDSLSNTQVILGTEVPTAVIATTVAFDSLQTKLDKTKDIANETAKAVQRAASSGGKISSGADIEKRAKDAGLIGKNAKLVKSSGSHHSFIEYHANGGILNEDVYGFGATTGNPHVMHAGETIVPASRSSGDIQVIINELGGQVQDIEVIVGEKRKRIMRGLSQGVFGNG